MEPKNFYLKTFNIASNLSDVQVVELCNNLTQKEARKNEVVYAKGGDKKIFILISGKLKIAEIDANGNEMIKELVLPGDLFGDG